MFAPGAVSLRTYLRLLRAGSFVVVTSRDEFFRVAQLIGATTVTLTTSVTTEPGVVSDAQQVHQGIRYMTSGRGRRGVTYFERLVSTEPPSAETDSISRARRHYLETLATAQGRRQELRARHPQLTFQIFNGQGDRVELGFLDAELADAEALGIRSLSPASGA